MTRRKQGRSGWKWREARCTHLGSPGTGVEGCVGVPVPALSLALLLCLSAELGGRQQASRGDAGAGPPVGSAGGALTCSRQMRPWPGESSQPARSHGLG